MFINICHCLSMFIIMDCQLAVKKWCNFLLPATAPNLVISPWPLVTLVAMFHRSTLLGSRSALGPLPFRIPGGKIDQTSLNHDARKHILNDFADRYELYELYELCELYELYGALSYFVQPFVFFP